MPINPSDANRNLKIDSPLGDDVVCKSFSGQDKLGRLFDYRIELLSLDRNIQFSKIVGQRVTVTLELDKGSRYFDAFVTEFRYTGTEGQYASYQATLKPWFWFLTRTADCRIFQKQSVPDIIKAVFKDNGMSDFEDALCGSYREWVYCVQYRETDFNFISRLMEQEGIYYYFKHVKGKHILVLSDSKSSHDKFPAYGTVPYYPPDANAALRKRDHIQYWTMTQSIVPGKYAIKDFDFEKPKVDLSAKLKEIRKHAYPIKDHEIFDYPGEYTEKSDGESYAKKKLQELQAQHERVFAGGSARGMCCGWLFKLDNYPRKDQNKEYLIVGVSHEARSDPLETSPGGGEDFFYSCQIEVLHSQTQYRSERITPKPIVQGPQSAIVVGPSGEEIYCDKYGRVKVQFHWDRQGRNDQDSSCWIRVSQAWAGTQWGSMHIPRIGQEVLVSFLEGDPDQPVITGRVYNAKNMPPYDLEENKTQSGIKSRSSKNGGKNNFNELRFEDKKGKEEVYFQAEKNLRSLVKNIETRNVRASRSTKIGEKNSYPPPKDPVVEETTIFADRLTSIDGNDVLDVALNAMAQDGRAVTVHNGDHKLRVSMGNQEIEVSLGNILRKASVGKINEEAMQSIELKVGANTIKVDQMGIHLKGIMINIEASAINTIKGSLVKIN
jgi:type VI secretion system secreted protein VgrG